MRRRVPKRHRPESFGVLYHPSLPVLDAQRAACAYVIDKLSARRDRAFRQRLKPSGGW